MTIAVGNETLGDTAPANANGSIGGLNGSTDVVIQSAPQAAGTRLKVKGSPSASMTLPVVRTFDTPGAAEAWWLGKIKAGYVAGNVTITAQGNVSNETWGYGIATLAGGAPMGCAVRATWQLTLGVELT